MTAPPLDRLALARWEADRHAAVLGDALARWQALPAPSLEAIESDPALRQLTDQILFRFIKLQDTMGERLIPATLGWLVACAMPSCLQPLPGRQIFLRLIGSGQASWLPWPDANTGERRHLKLKT